MTHKRALQRRPLFLSLPARRCASRAERAILPGVTSALPYTLIQRDDELAPLYQRLRAAGRTRIAIDVEGENNLHRYGIHVSLIQLYDGEHGYIVDVLALRSAEGLRPLLEKVPWTLVWFDAGNDLLSFQHALGIKPSPVLDLAIAARVLGITGGLHALTPRAESASAKDRLQKANWMRRPLSPDLLTYAISDVAGLFTLADTLSAELEKKGLTAQFEARNRAAQDMERSWDPFPNYTRIPGFKGLGREGKLLARLLWYARELYAKERDLPPMNAISKEDMRRLVDRKLRSAEDISRFLNTQRKKNLISAAELARCLSQAQDMLRGAPAP